MDDEPVSFSWNIEWHAIQTAAYIVLIAAVVLVIIGASILDSYIAQSALGECIATMGETK